jgi:hypothetical protein
VFGPETVPSLIAVAQENTPQMAKSAPTLRKFFIHTPETLFGRKFKVKPVAQG